MIILIKDKLLVTLFVFPLAILAQTSNVGELYVSPNTIMSVVENFDNKPRGTIMNDGDFVLYSHYNNDGIVTFDPNAKTGLTRFYGTTPTQNISGSIPIVLNNVEFNNRLKKASFPVTNELNFFGNVSFKNGIVQNDNKSNLLIFETTAAAADFTDLSHVDGFSMKKGITNFVFPSGNKEYAVYSKIAGLNDPSNFYNAKFVFDNSNSLYPHTNKASNISLIDQRQFWEVERTNKTSHVSLSLFVSDITADSAVNSDPKSDMHIVGWDVAQNTWIDLGGIYNDALNEIETNTNAVGLCSVFTLARIVADTDDVLADQGISPNNDGHNDFFYIKNIEKYPDNKVEIYNRWGVKVFEKRGYDNNPATAFDGISQAKGTIMKSEGLPEGVYFYIINYKAKDLKEKLIKSYLYIKK